MKRLIACLDVRDGKLAKSKRFVNTIDIGDPVISAKEYYEAGIDELVFYDITASAEKRSIMLDCVESVANQIFIPLSVGGGVDSVQGATDLRLAGADKINVNSAAVRNPKLLSECTEAIGSQSVVLSVDIRSVEKNAKQPSGYEVVICGGREPTGLDAIDWIQSAVRLGAGEVVVNSIDADGMCEGYDVTLTRLVAESVNVPVIASGGAGKPEHLYEVLTEGKADAALVASILHYGHHSCFDLKQYLDTRGVPVRWS